MLRPPGECPQWGTMPGAVTPMDGQIRDARDAPLEMQRKVFHGCVRHLFDAQVRDAEKARAVKAAFEVLDHEIEDAARGKHDE